MSGVRILPKAPAASVATPTGVLGLCNSESSQATALVAEGYFFPETYKITRVMSPREILRMGTRLFTQRWKPEYDARAQELGLKIGRAHV